MKKNRKAKFIIILLFSLVISAPSLAASASNTFPNRPIRLIVPFAPGGATDVLARLIAAGLTQKLGQTVVVENKPGAASIVGALAVTKASPDGYTLLFGGSTPLVLNPILRKKLPYDPVADFTPIGMVANFSIVLLASTGASVNSLNDLILQSKAVPGKLSYGSYGNGSPGHFAAEFLMSVGGFNMLHIPYNGSIPNLMALEGGQNPIAIDTVSASLPLIKSGKVKPLAVLSSKRVPWLPDVPTVSEILHEDFNAGAWIAILGPGGLPDDVQQRLEHALAELVADPLTVSKIQALGLTPLSGGGKAIKERVSKELTELRSVAVKRSIKSD